MLRRQINPNKVVEGRNATLVTKTLNAPLWNDQLMRTHGTILKDLRTPKGTLTSLWPWETCPRPNRIRPSWHHYIVWTHCPMVKRVPAGDCRHSILLPFTVTIHVFFDRRAVSEGSTWGRNEGETVKLFYVSILSTCMRTNWIMLSGAHRCGSLSCDLCICSHKRRAVILFG